MFLTANKIDAIKCLNELGADVNAKDNTSQTYMAFAAMGVNLNF